MREKRIDGVVYNMVVTVGFSEELTKPRPPSSDVASLRCEYPEEVHFRPRKQ